MNHTEHFNVIVGERDWSVFPPQLRQRLDLHPGDRLIITLDDEGGLRAMSARELARRLCGLYRDLAPGRSLTDELIAERREEARREDNRW